MSGYQMDASRWMPSALRVRLPRGSAVSAPASMMRRMNLSNCAAISVLPLSASGTPELSAVDTVL